MRPSRLVLCVVALTAACTTTTGTTSGVVVTDTIATSSTSAATSSATTTSTTSTPTSTAPVETTVPTPTRALYVVAEEQGRRLAVFEQTTTEPCAADEGAPCGPFERSASIALPHRPHNMIAAGPIVWVTHPSAGSVSRVDLTAMTTVTEPIGREPHDVKLSRDRDLIYVADEDGRAVIVADADTLQELDRFELHAKPHDLAVGADGTVWITLIGDDRLGHLEDGKIALLPTGRSPHDLIEGPGGRIWFSNWNSSELSIFDPDSAAVEAAPAGVVEPHHFAIDAGGDIWVSDNGGSAVVGFVDGDPITIAVGPVPHHIAFGPTAGIVAVSGSGQAVFVDRSGVIGRIDLSRGLHGAAVALLP